MIKVFSFQDEDCDSSMDSDSEIEGNELEDEVNLDENGIGCVRVIDNIDFGATHPKSGKPLYALILTPTRELAIQIKNHLCRAAKYTDIQVKKHHAFLLLFSVL